MPPVTISDLMQLSRADRIRLAQDLWDSIVTEAQHAPDFLPVTEAQRHEIVRRSEAHQRNPDEAEPLADALERIRRL